jgi:16S rRNA (guanine1516-N2)-methyltransferase
LPDIAVLALSAADEQAAAELAVTLGLPQLETGADPRRCEHSIALLTVMNGVLALQMTGRGAPGPVAVDFGTAAMRHRRRSGHNELLGKAVGVGKQADLRVIDATAGLGRDAFVLADLGCNVTLCERNPLIACLLESGLRRAYGGEDPWLQEVSRRMQLHCGAAQELDVTADVIYLDPMFPQRDKSAAVKKEMAVFQLLLEGEAEDGDELLAWALLQDVARVVVKRPPRAALLGAKAASHVIQGKAVRYDVHVRRSFSKEL